MKYELLEDSLEYIVFDDAIHPVCRIKALASFGDVSEGDIGGFVESVANLEGTGCCWVYDDAVVVGGAKVYDNARVSGNAVIAGNAKVYGCATVWGEAAVYGNSRVYDIAKISGNARIYGDAQIYDMARVLKNAEIFGTARVRGNYRFYGNNVVYDNIFDNKPQGAVINGDLELLKRLNGADSRE